MDTVMAGADFAIAVLLNTLFKAFVVFGKAGWAKGRLAIATLVASGLALAAAGAIALV